MTTAGKKHVGTISSKYPQELAMRIVETTQQHSLVALPQKTCNTIEPAYTLLKG